MQYPKVQCSKCASSFKFKPRTKKVKDLELAYCQCPECGKRYFTYITDSEIRARINKTEKIRFAQNQMLKVDEMKVYILITREMMKDLANQHQELISKYMKEPITNQEQ